MLLRKGGSLFNTERCLSELLRISSKEMHAILDASAPVEMPCDSLSPPIDDNAEVWAAGVTYKRSVQGRMEESDTPDVYDRVYNAERPELFYKANSRRIAGPNTAIHIRADSDWNVPEPELGLCVNSFGEIIGFTIGNDASSRTIEGENPLYLPQAKVYHRSCGLGPSIVLKSDEFDPTSLVIEMRISRNGSQVWEGSTNTSLLNRGLEELVSFLFREDHFPNGVFLLTGTCLVPEASFTLKDGDVVDIDIENLGRLTNVVKQGKGTISLN